MFIIYFNGAALRPQIPRPSWPFFSKKKNDPVAIKMKFVDDLSIAVKVSLNEDLVEDIGRQKPLTYDQRLETKIKDSNILKIIADGLLEFSSNRQMKVNSKKSCVMKVASLDQRPFPWKSKLLKIFLN